jgi:NADH:ubiquinone oxidoreductase subunit 4 (subunit M)
LRYLVMGTIGATFYLIGVGFLYIITGTLNMADLAERLQGQRGTTALPVAFAFILVGLGLKAAIMPLHAWLPNAYAYAPTAVTVFLAATATKAAVYGMMRLMFTVFGLEFSFEANVLPYVLMPLALIAMFAASAVAVWQRDIKRMLAWSSIAQLGYILLGLSLARASEAGLVGAIVHLFNHALMKTACFMAVGAFLYRTGTVTVAGLACAQIVDDFEFRYRAALVQEGVYGVVGFVAPRKKELQGKKLDMTVQFAIVKGEGKASMPIPVSGAMTEPLRFERLFNVDTKPDYVYVESYTGKVDE